MVSTASAAQVRALFANIHTAFDLQYLTYKDAIQFRGVASTKAIAWAGKATLFSHHIYKHLDRSCNNARLLLLVVKATDTMSTRKPSRAAELDPICVQEPLTATFLERYDKWVHAHAFGPREPKHVTELVGDGHAQGVVPPVCRRTCSGTIQ